MNPYKIKQQKLTKDMKDKAAKLVKYLREDYKEYGRKVGRVSISYDFETYLTREAKNGVVSSNSPIKETFYELLLRISFPLKNLGFTATDIHTYRWNVKRSEYEHESTEIW